jgi:tetratricopeptide (TPR) repeat protein
LHPSLEVENSSKQQVNLMMNLGEVLLATGRQEQALKYCEEALGIVHSHPSAKFQQQRATILLTKGKCLERQGHLNESLLCFESALKSYED